MCVCVCVHIRVSVWASGRVNVLTRCKATEAVTNAMFADESYMALSIKVYLINPQYKNGIGVFVIVGLQFHSQSKSVMAVVHLSERNMTVLARIMSSVC